VNHFKSALGEPWGCNLVTLVLFILGIGYGIYSFAKPGQPRNKSIFEKCYRRETLEYFPGYTPDLARDRAVIACTHEERRALGLNPNG
jgi:hypothetical protein